MLRELLDENVEIDEAAPVENELELRKLLIVVGQIEAEKEKLEKTKSAIAHEYAEKIGRLDERVRLLRASIESFVRANGKTSFPDVGTAYLSKTKPKVTVTDPEHVQEKYGDLFTKSVFDETDFRRYALERFESDGEILEGVDIAVPGETLAIRKA